MKKRFRCQLIHCLAGLCTDSSSFPLAIYPLLLNCILVSFYICIGTFNGLVTFVGTQDRLELQQGTQLTDLPTGIADYLFFFLAVLGIYKIRRAGVSTDYKTWTLSPVIFCFVSGFTVLRGIVTDPLERAAIGALVAVGWIIFKWKFAKKVVVAEVDMGS